MSKNEIDTSKMIFVFGSNEAGIHGAGAARYAYQKRSAQWGFSYGMTGSCFAIPTKGFKQIRNYEGRNSNSTVVGDTLPLHQINDYVRGFLAFARGHPEMQFQVTCIGCGLAGLRHEDIAPMFVIGAGYFDAHTLDNCWFDKKWEIYLPIGAQIWGEG